MIHYYMHGNLCNGAHKILCIPSFRGHNLLFGWQIEAIGGHNIAMTTPLRSQPVTIQSLASIPSSDSICVWEGYPRLAQQSDQSSMTCNWSVVQLWKWRLNDTLTLIELPNPSFVLFTQAWLDIDFVLERWDWRNSNNYIYPVQFVLYDITMLAWFI